MNNYVIYCGDALEQLKQLPDESVYCCVTSPPYWNLRDYNVEGQIGIEKSPENYIAKLTDAFNEVWRVLRCDGTLWLNIGDSYANNGSGGHGATGGLDKSTLVGPLPPIGSCPIRKKTPKGMKPKDLCGIPWMLAFSLRSKGWYLRQDIIWNKTNPMPESVRDRCTRSHEYMFMLSKSAQYYYDADAIAEPCVCTQTFRFVDGGNDKQRGHSRRHSGFNGRYKARIEAEGAPKNRNKRDVWNVATSPYPEAHFATFPPKLIEPCILAGCPESAIVLDPFCGAGTTGMVALRLGRAFIGIEIKPEYCDMAKRRLDKDVQKCLTTK